MHPATVFIACGYTFFLGAIMMLAGLILPRPNRPDPRRRDKILLSLRRLLILLGLAFQLIASAPLPLLYHIFAIVLIAAILLFENRPSSLRYAKWLRPILAALIIMVSLVLASFYRKPTISIQNDEPIHLIGDSISAGILDEEKTWPTYFSENSSTNIVNHAAAGATAQTALRQAADIPINARIVLIEIGGNDLLGGTLSREFEHHLRALLSNLSAEDRTLVMFELPLPPFKGGYARAQHRLAREYNVTLIPKQLLASAFAGPHNTTDGLHLSPLGHQHLASEVSSLLHVTPE